MAAFAMSDQLVLGRPLTDQEILDAQTLLERASRMIRRNYPDVDTRIAAGEISADDVADVVCQMVQRVLVRSVGGAETVTDQRGPFGLTVRYSNPEGGLYLTEDEKAVFNVSGVTSSTMAFTIDTTPAGYSWPPSGF